MVHVHIIQLVCLFFMYLNWYGSFYSLVSNFMVRGVKRVLQDSLLFSLLVCFLLLRIPYLYGMWGFCSFLIFLIFPLFLTLFFSRICVNAPAFFSVFVPTGTPLWIVSFVCLAETIRYVVRPLVLLLRPFVNLSLGAVAMFSLSSMYFMNSAVLLFLVIVFFYEIFVALVHWFIVCNILSFSADH